MRKKFKKHIRKTLALWLTITACQSANMLWGTPVTDHSTVLRQETYTNQCGDEDCDLKMRLIITYSPK